MAYRLFIPPNEIELQQKTAILSGADFHHASKVLRLREGEKIEVFDGAGRIYDAIIAEEKEKQFLLEIKKAVFQELNYSLSVFVGFPKGTKFDFISKALTEVGVTTIGGFTSKYSQVKPVLEKKKKRLRKIAIEACKQSGRVWVPEIVMFEGVDSLVEKIKELPGNKILFYEKAVEYLSLSSIGSKELSIVIGPEGGFAKEEVIKMKESSFQMGRLSDGILRMETAAVAAAQIAHYAQLV